MKKLKKLVIGGIESKVLTLVLVSMLLVATVFILSMLTQNKLLTDLSNDTNERQVASVTGITSTVIDTVIVDNMNRPQEVTASRVVQLEIMRERLRSQMDAAEQELTKAMIARHIDEGKLLQSKKANLQKEG